MSLTYWGFICYRFPVFYFAGFHWVETFPSSATSKDLITVTGGQASRLVNIFDDVEMVEIDLGISWRDKWTAVSDWCLQGRIKVLVSSFTLTLSCLVKSVTLQVLPAINTKIVRTRIYKQSYRQKQQQRKKEKQQQQQQITAQQQHALVNLTVTLQTNQENCV